MKRLSRWLVVGAVTALAYGWLVAPGFVPVSYRYDTSLHGSHESRFVKGWRIEQHPGCPVNIIARLGEPEAVFEFPPIETAYPLRLKLNLLPRRPCRYRLLLNDRPIGAVASTVVDRGEKFFFTVPLDVIRQDAPNHLTIINDSPESPTEWESIEIRNYQGTAYTPHWHILAGPNGGTSWQARFSVIRLLFPGLLGAAFWMVSAPLRQYGAWWLCQVVGWTAVGGALFVTTWLGTPLVASPFGFWTWWLAPSVVIAVVILLFGATRHGVLIVRRLLASELPARIATSLVTGWNRSWEEQFRQWPTLLAGLIRPIRYLVAAIGWLVFSIGWALSSVMVVWRWWRADPVVRAFYGFSGLLGAAAFCRYLQWGAAAEWLGTLAFGALVLCLAVVLLPQGSARPSS